MKQVGGNIILNYFNLSRRIASDAEKENNKRMIINKRTANRFITVITSPVIWYKVFREH